MMKSALVISLLLVLCSGTVRVPLETVKLRKASKDAASINGPSTQGGIGCQLLYDDVNVVTIGEVKVGTPPQTLRVAIDTTRGDLWVPGRLCTFYGCGQKRIYNSSKSQTYTTTGKKVNFGFELGTVYGTVGFDDVCIESFCAKRQTLIEVYQTSYNLWELPYDGVLGLSLPRDSVTDAKNLIINIAESRALKQSVFTIWKAKKPLTTLRKEESGMLTIGDYDRLHCSDFCTYVRALYPRWSFDINGISVGSPKSQNVNLTSAQYVRNSRCHIGASTPFILSPLEELMNIVKALKFYVNCDEEKTLPPIWFHLQEASLPIYPDSYIIKLPSNVCLLAFQVNTQPNLAEWVFGDPWFKQYCVVHDVSMNKRIGFCPSTV